MVAVAPEGGLDDRYLVQPVLKAMQVLQLVCEANEPITLNQLVRGAGLPKTTVSAKVLALAVCLAALVLAPAGLRSAGGTKCAPPFRVTLATKSRIASLAWPSFQEDSATPAIPNHGWPPSTSSPALHRW